MNESDTTEGGYANSDMVEITLPNVLNTYIQPVFGEHIIEYRNLLSKSVNTEALNKYINVSGASNAWDWYSRKLDLMSEVNVYGTTVTSSSMYDTGIDNRQYAIFQLKPEFINGYGTTRFHYWLKDVSFSAAFASAMDTGDSHVTNASKSLGVRPRFLID